MNDKDNLNLFCIKIPYSNMHVYNKQTDNQKNAINCLHCEL
jgi:hypothetical protein